MGLERLTIAHCLRSVECKEYFYKLKSEVGNKEFTYKQLPDELRVMKMFRRITDNGIAKKVVKSGAGSTWILIY